MRPRHEQRKLSIEEEARLEKALVRLIGSTRRGRRVKNLIEVSKEIDIAEKLLGSREAVAKKIGISKEMLREFASISKLHKSVKRMLKDEYLTSVDVVYRISMLPKSKQLQVAQAYVKKELSGRDVRDVIALRKRNPKWTIQEVIERVKSSKDIVQYVIRFRVREKIGTAVLRSKFTDIIGKGNIVSLELKGKIVNLTITEEGRKVLQREAKKRGMTKRKLVRIVTEIRE